VLEERERDGVTIDVCRHCRGVWLDRGELERFIAHAVEDRDALGPRNGHEPED
jgi:Zn-finger nucleic acid-binding protein